VFPAAVALSLDAGATWVASAAPFLYTLPLTLSFLWPPSGEELGGTLVSLAAAGGGAGGGSSSSAAAATAAEAALCRFGGAGGAVAVAHRASPRLLQCTAPPSRAGPGRVAVGFAHMPPLGSFLLNTNAISVVAEWITNDLPNRVIFDVWVKRSFPGSDPDSRARNSDPDADGLSNYEEYLLGEDPLDPVRRWSVGLRKYSEGVSLVFPKKVGRRFEVEWNDRLDASGSWSRYPHPSNDPGTAPVDSEALIPIPTDVDRFYRVRISED
jgi:hypothetical protein